MEVMTAARLAWGARGAAAGAARGDLVVVVDTLSFSTAVAVAVHHGATVWPCADGEDPHARAAALEAEAAVSRADVPARGRFSLSPLTYLEGARGARVLLRSPNGATCARRGGKRVLVGALVNAAATAGAARRAGLPVTVVACGERWEDGSLRVALEDYLGAGAVLAGLPGIPLDPDAEVCRAAFSAAAPRLAALLRACPSGRELQEHGHAEDVELAARLDAFPTAVGLQGEALAPWPVA